MKCIYGTHITYTDAMKLLNICAIALGEISILLCNLYVALITDLK